VVLDRRRGLTIGAAVAAELVVIGVAFKEPTSGAPAVVAALVLAPIAVFAVIRAATRLAGGWFPPAAGVVYALLPLTATRLLLPTYRPVFDQHALPTLVGLQSTWMLALGIVLVLAVAFAPVRVDAAAAIVLVVAAAIVWGFDDVSALPSRLHETAWSVALTEWLVVASVLGALLRSPAVGGALGAVLVATIMRAAHQPYDDGTFWRDLAPAAPAAAVLVSSLALLVPRLRPARRRPAANPAPAPPSAS
jgi:hypothetical protein